MKRPLVLLDVDGVLGCFATAVFSVVERLSGRSHGRTPKDLTTWEIFESVPELAEYKKAAYAAMREPGACYAIPVIEGAVEGVKCLREIADVHVVTSPFAESLTWMGERNLWLKDHFGFKESEVTHSDKKFMIVGDMLVDDKPAHCEAWQKARGRHGQALLWHQPHNAPAKTSVTRAYGWDNLLAYVKLRAALLS